MNNKELDKILKDYSSREKTGKFCKASEFKGKFFEAVKELPDASNNKSRKPLILILSTIGAVAAAILVVVFPVNSIQNISTEVNGLSDQYTRVFMKKLKRLFPERSVGLCLFNDDLKTFDSEESKPRNILVSYFLKRASDGKEIKLSVATSNDNKADLDCGQVSGSIWVFQPDKKVLTVDTDLALKLDDDTKIKISDSRLLKLNQKEFVSEFNYRGSKYQLYQSACRI